MKIDRINRMEDDKNDNKVDDDYKVVNVVLILVNCQ